MSNSGIEFFNTLAEVSSAAQKLIGWDWEIIRYGDSYVIKCKAAFGGAYLRENGYIK